MEHFARHLACVVALIAGCSSDEPDVCAAYAAEFQLIEPTGLTEMIDELRFTWTPPVDDVNPFVNVRLFDELNRYTTDTSVASEGQTTLDRSPVTGPAPGIYRVETELSRCGELTVIDGGLDLRIFVQGVTFPVLDFQLTDGDVPLPIELRSISLSTMEIEWLVGPLGSGDERQAFATSSVPGELFVTDRTVEFTGRDRAGEPIPSGTYSIYARITPRTGLPYELVGPTLYWTPSGT